MQPKAREENLIAEEFGNETLIYDTAAHRCHALNPTAAFVLRHLDGERTVSDLAALLQGRGLPGSEEVVLLALHRLDKAHLLKERIGGERTTRRAVIRKLGLTAGGGGLLPGGPPILPPTPAVAPNGPF